MSPEQMESTRGVDIRTDIWGLGVILYELLTGKTPFEGQALPEVCLRVATQQPPPMRNLRPDAPAQIELVILRCLEKDRDKRYGNVARLAVALRDFASARGKQSVETILRTVEASGQPLMSAAPAPMQPTEPAPPAGVGVRTIEPLGQTQIPQIPMQGGKGKTVGIAVAVAAVVVIGIVALRMAQSQSSSSTATSLVHSATLVAAGPAVAAPTGAPAASETPPAASAAPSPSDTTAAAASASPASTAAANAAKKAPAAAPKAPTSPPAGKSKPNCDPNYYLDAQGEKHFKPECFH
jgi:serine/threonine-protein kinase